MSDRIAEALERCADIMSKQLEVSEEICALAKRREEAEHRTTSRMRADSKRLMELIEQHVVPFPSRGDAESGECSKLGRHD